MLTDPFQKFIILIDVWCGLTLARHFERFMHQIWKVDNCSVKSTDGALTVIAPSSNSGKKPCQTKRKRCAQTKSHNEKKKL